MCLCGSNFLKRNITPSFATDKFGKPFTLALLKMTGRLSKAAKMIVNRKDD
jgi:hypothetical protein